jgi:ABC-2 type transport system permease protein/oleandomycin transport system permease protein
MTTAVTTAPGVRQARPITPWVAIGDTAAIAKRNLLHVARMPQLLVFSTIQPVMFVLLFRYVFGGAIQTPGSTYVDYLMAGIFVQTTLFGGAQTAVGLATDMNTGIVDRFRSLPMARSAVLAGRTLADLIRNVFVLVLMIVVGTAVGFRFNNTALACFVGMLLVLVFGYAFSWVFAHVGLVVKDPETAQVAGFIPLFPLVFASSAFVPVATMPGWLQGFARVQPVSVTVNAVRALTQGGPIFHWLWQSLVWTGLILVVFVPLAVARYRRV